MCVCLCNFLLHLLHINYTICSSLLSFLTPVPSDAFGREEVVVEYKYDAHHEDELTLQPGDIIKNVRYIEEDGWMEGDLNGKRGLFPDNFVKVRRKTSSPEKPRFVWTDNFTDEISTNITAVFILVT